MPEFDPKISELIARGATASMLLEAQRAMSTECITRVLGQISQHVEHGNLTSEKAIGFCHEIAAFQRIVRRQEQTAEQGRRAEQRIHNG